MNSALAISQPYLHNIVGDVQHLASVPSTHGVQRGVRKLIDFDGRQWTTLSTKIRKFDLSSRRIFALKMVRILRSSVLGDPRQEAYIGLLL